MHITIAGAGYVGLANAFLLARHNKIIIYDIDKNRLQLLSRRKLPIHDADMERVFAEGEVNFSLTDSAETAFTDADVVIIATPTDYDDEKNHFDTSSIEDVLCKIARVNTANTIIIRSTVPVGYTEQIRLCYNRLNIVFMPEFLREGKALFDSLNPSRIVIGDKSDKGKELAAIFSACLEKKDVPIVFTDSTEAEAIKLFANTYLAMRVAYFNELDSYAAIKGLNTADIIKGVCLDPRIGDFYNNPSFGYGGYCLPKDSKQLLANFDGVPQNIVSAIVEANRTRKDFIADEIKATVNARCRNSGAADDDKTDKIVATVGVYRLTAKSDSDNFRTNAMQDIVDRLLDAKLDCLIYEPLYGQNLYRNAPVTKNLAQFKAMSDVIIANRAADELYDVQEKVYTRDLYGRD